MIPPHKVPGMGSERVAPICGRADPGVSPEYSMFKKFSSKVFLSPHRCWSMRASLAALEILTVHLMSSGPGSQWAWTRPKNQFLKTTDL